MKAVMGLLLCLGLTACFEPIQDTHPGKVLTQRRALFKQFSHALSSISLVTSGRRDYQPDELLRLVQDLDALAAKPWVYFPADGNYPPTHARPAVWSHPEAFTLAQVQYQASVHALLLAAQAGQLEPIQRALDKVTGRCKACHKDFRYE